MADPKQKLPKKQFEGGIEDVTGREKGIHPLKPRPRTQGDHSSEDDNNSEARTGSPKL